MLGRINDSDLVTLAPCESETLAVGDMVLVRIQGRRYVHLVLHQVLQRELGRLLIGNNHGNVNGWVAEQDVYGRVTAIDSSPTVEGLGECPPTVQDGEIT